MLLWQFVVGGPGAAREAWLLVPLGLWLWRFARWLTPFFLKAPALPHPAG